MGIERIGLAPAQSDDRWLAREMRLGASVGAMRAPRLTMWALIVNMVEGRLAMRRSMETPSGQPQQSGSRPDRMRARHSAPNTVNETTVGSRGAAGDDFAGLDEFEEFFRQYERQVVACLWRIIGDEQAAHDLSQETFLRAWRHFDQIRSYDQPGAWLLRVATNLALNYLRQRGSPIHSAKPLSGAEYAGERDDSSEWREALASSDPSMRFVERDLVQQTLLELSPQQRAALVLREVYGLSCEEIGRVLGASRDAIKMTLYRGREQFRRVYLRKGGAQ